MGILKLQNEGDTHTMLIRKCEEVAGQYGQQVLFSDGTDTLYLPKESADRQLGRLGLDDYDAVVDMNLTFSRDPNPKKGAKPYWGIRYAGAEPVEAKPSKRMEAPEAKQGPTRTDSVKAAAIDPANLQEMYLSLWDTMAAGISLSCATHNVTLTADAVQAATATLWIAMSNRGLLTAPASTAKAEPTPRIPTTPPASGKRLAPPRKEQEPPDYSNFPPPTDDDLPFD